MIAQVPQEFHTAELVAPGLGGAGRLEHGMAQGVAGRRRLVGAGEENYAPLLYNGAPDHGRGG